jgi:hypothetical protein
MLSCLLLPAIPLPAMAQTPPHYAIFSPAIVARLPSLAGTPVAGHILDKANEYVDANPDPLSRVHTKGTLNGNKGREKSLEAEKDWQGMLALGLAYRLTGDKKYVSAADRYLAAWSAVYKVSFNPIDETHMSEFMLAYDLTTGSPMAKHGRGLHQGHGGPP